MEKIEIKKTGYRNFSSYFSKNSACYEVWCNLFMVQWQKEAARKEQKNKTRLELDMSLQSVGREGKGERAYRVHTNWIPILCQDLGYGSRLISLINHKIE